MEKKFYESFTDESKTIILIDELLESIKQMSLEEGIQILKEVLTKSEEQNDRYKKQLIEYENFFKKREVTSPIKRKIVKSKKVTAEQKKYFCDEIKNYKEEIQKIIDLSFEDFINYISKLVLEEKDLNYLLLGISKELNFYNKISDDAYIEKDTNLIKEIKEHTKELVRKMDFLKSLRSNLKSTSHDEKYRIIFFETSSKRAYFLEDIEGKEEYYDSFEKLLLSIEKGQPKSMKTFHNLPELQGLFEARDVDGKTRIFFDRVDEKTYIIINAIIKKSDNTTGYRNQIINRYKKYLINKPYILSQLTNDNYLKQQTEYLEEAKSLFNKSKTQILSKIKKEGN